MSIQTIIEVKINSIWEDISKDVVSELNCKYGIRGNSINDRVSSVGELKFTLRNDSTNLGGVDNFYTPFSSHAKQGWKKGIPVRIRILYGAEDVTKFYGHISDFDIDVENKRIEVLVSDWIDYASNYPMNLLAVSENKRIDEIVPIVISGMSIQPLNTEYHTGIDTFTSIFDTVKDNTRAIGEFQKLAQSELGYIYLKKDAYYGETLVVEGRTTRKGGTAPTKIPKSVGYLLNEDSSFLLLETGSKIYLNDMQNASFDNNTYQINLKYGDEVINKISTKAYPRRIDTTAQVLFTLDEPLLINASETLKVSGAYKDPTSQAYTVAGKNMITPVATTDYLMNTLADGTGTNLTSYLTVTANYLANRVEYTLVNSGSQAGYITLLQARGYGIYINNPVSYSSEDTTSQNENGIYESSLDLKYQNNILASQFFADALLSLYKNPKVNVETISFLANTDDLMMLSFLYLDVGSLIQIVDDKSGLNNYYYINGIDYSITQGGIIRFTWIITPAVSMAGSYFVLDTSLISGEDVIK